MHGYILAEGIYVQRKIVRETLSSLTDRIEKKKPISRRVYKVPTPNSVWHMDGHMKYWPGRYMYCANILLPCQIS